MRGGSRILPTDQHRPERDAYGLSDRSAILASPPSRSAEAIFARNRAVGRIGLRLDCRDGVTRRTHVREEGSLRVRFPNTASIPEAVLVNTAGGMAGGDRFDLDIELGPDAQLTFGTAAAEKIYRALNEVAALTIRLSVSPGAKLYWLPQEAILFDRVGLSRRIDIDLAGDAALILAEAVVFGRAAMGERVERGAFTDRWRVRRDGRLIFAETLRLDGAIAATLDQRAVAGGAAALATLLLAPADPAIAARIQAVEGFVGEVGASAFNGIALVRLLAEDGTALRKDMMRLLAALDVPLPRLWLN
jgi:urease accessory protein